MVNFWRNLKIKSDSGLDGFLIIKILRVDKCGPIWTHVDRFRFSLLL
jgi:hypothetical protein